ncbi:MAG: hypothetical protein ACRCVN_00500 [Spirochaetia bacterium]
MKGLRVFLFIFVLASLSANSNQADNVSQNTVKGYVVKYHPVSRLKSYEAMDSNDDGVLDTFYYYDAQGLRLRQELDSNYDGNIDIWIHFRNGVYIEKIVKDTNHDGKPDYEKVY